MAEKEALPEEAPKEAVTSASQQLPQLRILGQFHKSYILAEGDDGLYIIDQHAAQERYHYEQIRSAILSGNTDTQQLLLPLQVETSIYAVSRVEDSMPCWRRSASVLRHLVNRRWSAVPCRCG